MTEQGQLPRVSSAVKVVRMPAEIDYDCAAQVGYDLAAAIGHGVTTVIADFSACTFCDTAGIWEIVRAVKLAAARNVALRLVVPPALTRLLELTGLAGMVALFPTLTTALAAE